MQRDIANLRNLEVEKNKYCGDIIYKKSVLQKIFESDPDLIEVLGKPTPRPLNKYADPNAPTPDELAERDRILIYNEKIEHNQIIPFIKLNGIQQEVLNFIMYDIDDVYESDRNQVLKRQRLTVTCLVHEGNMETEYGIIRTDLLSYIVKDLLCWSNALGSQLKLVKDYNDIVDAQYYARIMRFESNTLNSAWARGNNPYDKFIP